MTVNSVIQFHLHVLNGTIDFRALQMWQAGGKVESNIVVSRSLVAFRAIRQQSSRIISLSLSHSETSCSISEEFRFITVSRWRLLYEYVSSRFFTRSAINVCLYVMFVSGLLDLLKESN